MRYKRFIAIPFVLSSLVAACSSTPRPASNSLGLYTNDQFFRGLYNSQIRLDDEMSVFERVFSQLDSEVTVYTGENNYYVQFPAAGRIVGSIISLSVKDRDDGKLGFSFIERNENLGLNRLTRRVGGGKTLDKSNGVDVKRLDAFKYEVSFKGKKVIFNLYDPGLVPPAQFQMGDSEVYVGPVVDEAGFEFYLMFHEKRSHLFLILNETIGLTDVFNKIDGGIVMGERSRFAFYDDEKLKRKIFIGAQGDNTLENN